MKKLIQLLLLFCLLTLILVVVLLQTPVGKDTIREWIEQKTEGTVTVGKIKGLLPFWIRLHDVRYQTKAVHAEMDEMDLFLSPTTFLLGKLSILRLSVNHAAIQISGDGSPTALNWPASPFPLSVYSMAIDSLSINQFKGISLSGMGEVSDAFSFHLTVSYEDYIFRLGLDGDAEEQTVGIITHTQQDQDLNLWVSGIYDWKKGTFTGETYGKAYSWNVKGCLLLADSVITFSDASIDKGSFSTQGEIVFDLDTHRFHSEGTFLERPFSAQGMIAWTNKDVDLTDFSLLYLNNMFYGLITYHLKTESLTGELDLELNDLSLYSIEGKGHGHLSIRPDQTAFTFSGSQVQWKDLTFSKMTLEGKIKEERLTFQLALRDFIVLDPAYEVFPTAHLDVSGTATKESLNLKGEVWGLGSTPFILLAEIPLAFKSKPFDIGIDRNAPFAIHLKGEGSIDPILAFLENASLIASGNIDVDLALTGTWDNPILEGTLIYDNGRVESLATGALYRGIHMELEGEGSALKIRSMVAHDLGRGDLSGTGRIEWNPEKGFPFEFVIHTKHFTLLAIDPLTTTVDAQLTLSGNIYEMSITGNATIVEGHLAIPNKMPTQVPTLDVTYINPLPTPKPEIEAEKKEIPIHWNVHIEIPRKLTIDGRGLVSEWRGRLHLFGPQNTLHYSGKLKLIQGRFSLVGKTFDLVEGNIQIEGLEPKDIVVELRGDLELATITASINVCGSLDSTHVAFTSSPPMSTNQILSWILFNQDVNELTPFQACRLANVLVQLSGTYAGPSVFNNIKEGLGIDVFDITNCDIDSADLTFQVGKYISQGTFVGVSKSLSGDFDSVLIQTRLYRDFYLEGDYGGSLNGLTPNGGKLIFKWYKTY